MSTADLRGLDERAARAAWSRLAEPGDRAAVRLVRRVGAVDALALVAGDRPVPPDLVADDGDDAARATTRAQRAAVRWQVRRPDCVPRRDLAVVTRLGGGFVVPGDDAWPGCLADLDDAEPFGLWVRGEQPLAPVTTGCLALVGARASTGYGERVAADLAAGVAGRGTTVLSGGAYGIDAAAHRGALSAGGVTVAVLACGVDRFYPRGNESLLRRVAEEGLVVTELPPGSAPGRSRFLHRNRLIAALGAATVVVEAAWRSGALSTAAHAAGLGRPLGAVPGPVTSSSSAGCHRALRDLQATCVTDAVEASELVEPVGAVPPSAREVPVRDHDGLGEHDLRVLDAVPVATARDVFALSRAAGLPVASVQAALGRLQLLDLVHRSATPAGSGWRRARRSSGPDRLTARPT